MKIKVAAVGQVGIVVLALSAILTCSGGLPVDSPGVASVETHSFALVPSGFVDETVATFSNNVTQMEFAPDGRLFVSEQSGRLRVIKGGSLLAQPFVTLTVDSSGERGLLGVAFDPNFASNQFIYLYYTTGSGGSHNRLSRFTANGDVVAAGSELVLVNFDALSSATNHNGGGVHIGQDNKIYVSVGDNANGSNAQTLNNRLGKLHRLNLDGSIPSDNPFFSSASGLNRSIFALGLRNPYTFAVQPGTGKIFIDDVGEGSFEEIDLGIAGANYGWPHAEGPNGNLASDTKPLYSYGHGSGQCAITGGTFYNPAQVQFPSAWVGHYFFTDYCAGWIKRLDTSSNQPFDFATGHGSSSDLKTGADGALYYAAGGKVGRIRAASSQAPNVDVQPSNQTVAVGRPATFSVSASGTSPLGYQWQRDGSNIAGATSASYTLASATLADSGAQFRVMVSNGSGTVTSNVATLTVISNQPPVARITAPADGSLYVAGQTISYAGTGSDPDDGNLPGSAFTWEVVFHHDTHTHPFMQPTTGATSGTFVIPNMGETSTNVWYRIHLTVKDSAGLTSTTSVDIRPQTAVLTLLTVPAGLQLTLDGQPVTAPAATPSVVGMVRTLGVVSPQSSSGKGYLFSSWSDGGAGSHTITMPSTDRSFTATYVEAATGGQGLTGEYFDNMDFTGTKVTRVDATVNFDWGNGAPDPGIGPDTFSVRWTGGVTPGFSETYRFYTRADDGMRLWVNGQAVINQWIDQSATEQSGTIALEAGKSYAIKFEYYENGGGASAMLSWSSPSTPKQIIPASRLAPTFVAPPPPPPGFPIKINFQLGSAPVPAGYLVEAGGLYGTHGTLSYGWNKDHTDVTRDRDLNPDQRLDTLSHFHAGGVWEIAVPNGTYNVLVSVGDPGFDSTHTLNVEATSYWSAVPLRPNQFLSATKAITVSDGKLTINQGSAVEKATRINYLEISQ